MDDPSNWRSFVDPKTGKRITLSREEINIIRKLQAGTFAAVGYNPHEPSVDWFTQDKMVTPLVSRTEPKRRFAPSKTEALRVARMVRLIRKGLKIGPKQPEPPTTALFDLWKDSETSSSSSSSWMQRHVPAPKVPLPEHGESYNPPPEYLPTGEEAEAFANLPAEERVGKVLPQHFDSLRHVPAYDRFIQERFSRCLDLYLCAREVREKIQMNPDDLLPVLPDPHDLRPFPTTRSLEWSCLDDPAQQRLAGFAVDPTGQFIATLSHSKESEVYLKIWEVSSGKCTKSISLLDDSGGAGCISWNPANRNIIAISTGMTVFIISLTSLDNETFKATDTAWIHTRCCDLDCWKIEHEAAVSQISWHRKGDYFAVLAPGPNQQTSLVIHQLSKRASQHPFTKFAGSAPVSVAFYHKKPWLALASRQSIRIYDLVGLRMIRKLIPEGVRGLSCMAVHPTGDHLVVGSLERRLCWFDLDLASRPYRIMQPHRGAIRSVAIHQDYPNLHLLATASDDGTVQVMHTRVYDELDKDTLIVPVKILQVATKSVQQCTFHPTQPWLFCATTDGKVSLWV